ncbi:MAG: ABC transporter permease, partial [Anaerotruncus colihominis]
MRGQEKTAAINLRKPILFTIGVYILAIVLFYFLAGEQLHFRKSRGDIELLQAESGTVELVQGSSVEQIFVPKIQRLKTCSVQWGS